MDKAKDIVQELSQEKKKIAHSIVENAIKIPYVNTLLRQIAVFDQYTEWHCISVAAEAVFLGIEMNLSASDLEELAITGLLHDLGKIMLDKDMLNKRTPLTDDDFTQIKSHPAMGVELLEREIGEIPTNIRRGILEHHENWIGDGYYGLKGEEISLNGRILRITDSFDAMMDNRPYHDARNEKETLGVLFLGMGSSYDPEVIKYFFDLPEKGKMRLWSTERDQESEG